MYIALSHASSSPRTQSIGNLLEDDSSEMDVPVEQSEPGHQEITTSDPSRSCPNAINHSDGDPALNLAQDADNHVYSTPIAIETNDDPETIYEFGDAHKSRFNHEGNLGSLERAIGCLTRAVELAGEEHSELPKYLFGLADALLQRFERFSGLAFLEDAIKYQRRGISLVMETNPQFLADLGYSLIRRFQVKGEVADLNEAIELQELAVASTINDIEKVAICYNALGTSLVLRFENSGDPLDLERAIELHQRSFELELAAEMRATTAHLLGSALQRKYLHFVDIEYIERAISYQQQAVDLTSTSHTGKPGYLTNMAVSLHHRFEHLGEVKDIICAISHQLTALDLLPRKHSLRSSCLGDLGKSYLLLFGNTGNLTDIEKSIEHLLEALEHTPQNSPDSSKWLSSLGDAFRQKFELLGELIDIDRAINYHHSPFLRQPGQLRPSWQTGSSRQRIHSASSSPIDIWGGNKKAQAALHNLGGALCRRFDYVGQLDDIHESIAVIRQAISISAKSSYSTVLHNSLGISLLSQYRRTNRLEDINESIYCLEYAISLTMDGHSDMPNWLQNISFALKLRDSHTPNPHDIAKAIIYQTKAVDLTPEHHVNRPALLTCIQKAALSVGSPQHRFEAAYRWGQMLLLQEESPLEAYKIAFAIIPQVVWIGTTIDQRYKEVAPISRLATQAVASAIAEKDYKLALEWFEEGRSIVWGQVLQLRTSLDQLREVDQALAEEMQKVGKALNRIASLKSSHSNPSTQPNVPEHMAQSHHRLAEDWDRLLGRIRQLDGFSDFLRPKKANSLLRAARNGHVIIINVHDTACNALIIRGDRAALDCVPLPELCYQKALDAQNRLMQLLRATGVRQRSEGSRISSKTRGISQKLKDLRRAFLRVTPNVSSEVCDHPEGAPRPQTSSKYARAWTNRTERRPLVKESLSQEDELENILQFLWVHIVHPILTYLDYLNPKLEDGLPHVTWCVSGPIAFLPLHAAGDYKSSYSYSRTFNCVVSSYSPTISGLLTSSPSIQDFSGILMISQVSTPGFSTLPGTEKELSLISQHFSSLRVTKLSEMAATPDAVLEAIGSHSWVHFACHASQIAQDPALVLYISIPAFAFLSACQTATGDYNLPEEAVHLAAGMIMAGYPTVIATMWSIEDGDAPLVADHTYAHMLKDGEPDSTKASYALHQALSALREKVGERNFISWVPYIHIGI
ncbi:TPR-like protein [Rhizoctonia solani]|uniref:TPR-like protein n=1 Tax=Rhizoctonia solani TaxID=456999 RepID=A0A8H7I995_9AGAM|nr:TPR-like protein [Rhizoctonia solani]